MEFSDCCVALPRGAIGFLQFVIVVFPDHIHLLFLICSLGSFVFAARLHNVPM